MKNNLLFPLLTTALLSLGSTAFGFGEIRPLTLPQAIQMGIQNSGKLQLDSARILQAEARYEEARERALPEFDFSAQQMFLNQPTVDLKIPLKQGGEAGSVEVNRLFMANLSASVPIYAGGRIRYGKESSRLLLEAARLGSGNNKTAVAYTVAQAYNNLSKTAGAISVIEENLRTARNRDSTFIRLENNGVIPRNERLKAQLQTSNTELQLLEAQSNYQIARSALNLLLGLPENTEIQVDKSYATSAIPDAPYESYLQQALEVRQDVKALRLQSEAAEVGIKAAQANYLPTVAAAAGYMYVDVPNLLNVMNALNAGVAVKYNISNFWKNKSAVHLAEARALEVDANRRNLTDAIRLQINQDYQGQQLSLRKIAVYEKAQQQAEENARIVKNKYDNGLATVTDLLEADAALLNTRLNVSYARSDAALAYYRLLQTTGSFSSESFSY